MTWLMEMVNLQARLTSLGLHKTITELRSIASSAKPPKTHVRNYRKKVYELTSLRRSNRLKEITATATATVSKHDSFRRSERLRGKSGNQFNPFALFGS